MTVKDYLRQIYIIDQNVKRLQAQRDDLRNDLYNLKSASGSMSVDKVQSSHADDKVLKIIATVNELEKDIVAEMNMLIRTKTRIIKQISGISDERYKTLLFKRYVLFHKWEKIAEDMNYNLKWVYDLHRDALQAFGEKWGSETGKVE